MGHQVRLARGTPAPRKDARAPQPHSQRYERRARPGARPHRRPAKNNWTLGTGSDTPPSGLTNEGFGAEARWNVDSLRLQPGHAYRLQFTVHDGDQHSTGGDVGQACMHVLIPG